MMALDRTGAKTIKCPTCPAELACDDPSTGGLKHHPDGSHTLLTGPTDPRPSTDSKLRGRPRG